MTKKPSGLAAFTVKKAEPSAPPSAESAPSAPAPAATTAGAKRGRGQGDTVALTVRLRRSDWTRLHQLAMSEGVSLQALAVQGFTAVLAKHGLPEMETS